MIRFTKQRDHYTCGPIAIINVCKWAGYKVTQKDIKKFKKLTNCDNGTYAEDLHKALKKLDEKYFKLKKRLLAKEVKVKEIKKHCKQHGIVLLRFQWPDDDEFHYILVIKFTKHRVGVVNYFPEGPAYRLIYKSTFKKLVENQYQVIAWLINYAENAKRKGCRISPSDF